jgi:dihydroxyacetone kinase-like protein
LRCPKPGQHRQANEICIGACTKQARATIVVFPCPRHGAAKRALSATQILAGVNVKKLLNDPNDYVDDMLDGLCAAHPHIYRRHPDAVRVVMRARGATPGKVGVVTGGGSGHLPVFHGYVGEGLLDAAAVGNVFAGPRVDDCLNAMRAADGGAGVLQLYGNYGGDRMNFEMAKEFAELENMQVASVRVADDIASAPSTEREKRRGVAGLVYAFKLAGAKAEQRAPLAEVAATARRAADACRSIGVALTPCVVPEVGRAPFEIAADEIEFGMGIHGEPGIWRGKLKRADELANEMLERLLADMTLGRGDRVSVLVNSLGATPLEELYILYRSVSATLRDKGIDISMPLVGRYATSMEMTGASLTLLPLDDEFSALLAAPANCPFWSIQ